jgi:hypothetical protein
MLKVQEKDRDGRRRSRTGSAHRPVPDQTPGLANNCPEWRCTFSDGIGHRSGRQFGNRNNKIIAIPATVKKKHLQIRRFGNSATKAFFIIVYFLQYFTGVMT